MLADQQEYVIGVDPHRDTHALAIVDVRSGGIVLETSVEASSSGYARARELASEYAPGRRAFAIEGCGSFGAGLTRFSPATRSGCSRSGVCDASGVRAARATRSTRSVLRAVC